MNLAKLRAWWSHTQGLDGSLAGQPPAAVLARTGWARSVAGAGPYLTLFSRAGTSREAADAAVANAEIHELPAARGCTFVVPACDYAVALKAGQAFNESDMNVARKLGVTDKEIDKLCSAVVKSLGTQQITPDEIRDAVGTAARSLGDEGKKKGVSTTLPLALGKLQALGEIRRIPINGRIDQQRYRYAAWRPNPLATSNLSADEAYTELARRFFRWIPPATLAEFQSFSGLGANAAKAAVAPLALTSIEDRFMFADDLDRFHSFQIPKAPHYVLTGSLDALNQLRRDIKMLLADEDAALPGNFADLPNHGIFDRGRLVGLWDYDTATESIAWKPFIKRNAALEKAVKMTEQFVREQLGDARSFSLDTPKSRVSRIAALR